MTLWCWGGYWPRKDDMAPQSWRWGEDVLYDKLEDLYMSVGLGMIPMEELEGVFRERETWGPEQGFIVHLKCL